MGQRTTFFTVDRRLLESELWLDEPFTRAQAWLDLIGRAAYEDNELTKRGELVISERALARRWKWNKPKVHRFMLWLEKEGMIKRTTYRTTNRTTNGTTVSVEKYDVFQLPRTTNRTTNRTGNRTLYNNINNITNISLYMPDGIRGQIESLYGSRTEALLADVRRYYEGHPEREFPGWLEAVSIFAANQERWAQPKKQRKKTIAELAEEALGNDE